MAAPAGRGPECFDRRSGWLRSQPGTAFVVLSPVLVIRLVKNQHESGHEIGPARRAPPVPARHRTGGCGLLEHSTAPSCSMIAQ
jgi:hypothetical protein